MNVCWPCLFHGLKTDTQSSFTDRVSVYERTSHRVLVAGFDNECLENQTTWEMPITSCQVAGLGRPDGTSRA